MSRDRHRMDLHRRLETGAEEWHCPTCGRQMRLRVEPERGEIDVEVTRVGQRGVEHWGGAPGVEFAAGELVPGPSTGDGPAPGAWLH